MFGHTSVRFLLLSIMLMGMAAMVLCTCNSRFGETCEHEEFCSCPHHGCCHTTSSVKKNQCMTQDVCTAWVSDNSKRRAIQRQKGFLGMVRGLDS